MTTVGRKQPDHSSLRKRQASIDTEPHKFTTLLTGKEGALLKTLRDQIPAIFNRKEYSILYSLELALKHFDSCLKHLDQFMKHPIRKEIEQANHELTMTFNNVEIASEQIKRDLHHLKSTSFYRRNSSLVQNLLTNIYSIDQKIVRETLREDYSLIGELEEENISPFFIETSLKFKDQTRKYQAKNDSRLHHTNSVSLNTFSTPGDVIVPDHIIQDFMSYIRVLAWQELSDEVKDSCSEYDEDDGFELTLSCKGDPQKSKPEVSLVADIDIDSIGEIETELSKKFKEFYAKKIYPHLKKKLNGQANLSIKVDCKPLKTAL